MVGSNITQYPDGSYSASKIEFGINEGDSYSKIMDDVKNGKVKHIGEAICFDGSGNMKKLLNLKS